MELSTSANRLLTTDSTLTPAAPLTPLQAADLPMPPQASSLLFIDSAVSDYQQLIADVQPGVEVHVLTPTEDAVTQITQTLLGRSGISSVHIVSHGAAGSLQLGSDRLDEQTIGSYAGQLQAWGKALTPDGDILLYGCDVAEGNLGQQFVQTLAQLTQADIAASTDLTGSAALGGNWTLESQTGAIEAPLAFNLDALAAYNYTLLNSAPVLDTSGNPTLPTVNPNFTNPAGIALSDLISRLGGNGITDVDGNLKALAVTGVNNTNGTWQYSTNAGSSWTNFGNTVSDSNAIVLGTNPLYTPNATQTPNVQSWLSFTSVNAQNPLSGPQATQTGSTTGTTFDSTADSNIYAGYSNYSANPITQTYSLKNPNFPTIDVAKGFSVSFTLQMLANTFTNSDRAAFSITVVSSDTSKAIELGFQSLSATTGRIFSQGNSFTAAETASFDTNQETTYTLTLKDNGYQLLANGTPILSGVLHDYRAYLTTTPDPYEVPNFVFLGDNSSSAQGRFKLGQVAIQTETRVRFVPNTNYVGSSTISFRAWDGTDGSANGATVNTSTNGGTTAFSTATETAQINVASVGLDLNSDGRADILWKENSGQIGTWTLNGGLTSPFANVIASVDPNSGWEVRGFGDFNRDGKTDILWRNRNSGDVGFWLMNNAVSFTPVTISVGDTSWDIAGTGDFDADGKTDILWRNRSSGDVGFWLMNDTAIRTVSVISAISADWQIQGVADFDQDGKSDILWRNQNSGDVGFWLMNGGAIRTTSVIPNIGLDWQIQDVGDFNGDGKTDILWRNRNSGDVGFWLMNGTAISTTSVIAAIPFSWQIEDVGDYNADGKSDVLLRNLTTGEVGFWLMNGTTIGTASTIPNVSLDWSIVL